MITEWAGQLVDLDAAVIVLAELEVLDAVVLVRGVLNQVVAGSEGTGKKYTQCLLYFFGNEENS